tara:strand:+ start:72 stop:569 length:498 start_codon:yes stop_codon:yes gene_type:complete
MDTLPESAIMVEKLNEEFDEVQNKLILEIKDKIYYKNKSELYESKYDKILYHLCDMIMDEVKDELLDYNVVDILWKTIGYRCEELNILKKIKSIFEETIVRSHDTALYYTELDLNTENDYKMSVTLLKLTSYEHDERSEYICCISCKKILECDCVNCSAINNYYN